MQRHQILINKRFSAETSVQTTTMSGFGQSFIVDSNGYFLNNVSGLGDGIVNPTNVRAYLNDTANQKVISDFFSYLTGNTTQDQFREIFYSDQKLSNLFNNFYIQSVLGGQQSSVYYADQQLTGTTQITYIKSNFNWDGFAPYKNPFTGVTQEIHNSTRFTELMESISTFTTDESYYVPVYIKKAYEEASEDTLDLCQKTINLLLNPINSFVVFTGGSQSSDEAGIDSHGDGGNSNPSSDQPFSKPPSSPQSSPSLPDSSTSPDAKIPPTSSTTKPGETSSSTGKN